VHLRWSVDACRRYKALEAAMAALKHASGVEEKRATKAKVNKLKGEFDTAGLHAVKNPMWDDKYTDAYQNRSLSPLHVAKGTLKDLVERCLCEVYEAC